MGFIAYILVVIGINLCFPVEWWTNEWWGRTILLTGLFIAAIVIGESLDRRKK